MHRRIFLKTLSLVAATALLPTKVVANPINFSMIQFDENRYTQNNAQTIMVFLYGGPSELSGNLTNLEEISLSSQSDYGVYFNNEITPTQNNFWQEAGGQIMEEMLSSGDMNIFRTCYSQLRDDERNRSHGLCVSQNQRGVNSRDNTNGIFSNIANTLYLNGMIDENTRLPFISMEGDSNFFRAADFSLEAFLKPIAFSSDLKNPYFRGSTRPWYYYTSAERGVTGYENTRATFDATLDSAAQSINPEGRIKENFDKRVELDDFISDLNNASIPASINYPDNFFAKKLSNAIKILSNNSDTKIISLGSGGLGGWDDHSDALDYPDKMEDLFSSLKVAVQHLKAEGIDGRTNIMVFGDFGRNVNLNNSFGWDHGNLQNLFLLGGKDYFNHVGVVGETKVEGTGEFNRLFLKPADNSYWFEPYSIAATLYSIYGITNPEYLTGGFGPIENGLLS
ncbi:MAG: DUF1501 domain-containing protein [Sulfurimonas sp.]|nr:DUF1501 domain-containing protein [Sulfurimonas sp.]